MAKKQSNRKVSSVQGKAPEFEALKLFKEAAGALPDEILVDQIDDIFLRTIQMYDRLNLVLGEVLYWTSENGYFKRWKSPNTGKPFATFEEWVEYQSIEKSKADDLMEVYRTFVLDLEWPDFSPLLEWEKAKELIPVITDSNEAALTWMVISMSVSEVKELVRQMQENPNFLTELDEGADGTPTGL